MKLAVSSYSLSRWRRETGKTLEDSVRWVAQEAGVSAIEFSGIDPREGQDPLDRAAEMRRLCEQQGLGIAGFSVGAELLVPPEEQKKLVERLKVDVRTAAALGVKNMRHDVTRGPKSAPGSGPKMTLKQVLDQVAPAVREVAEFAQPLGVKTSLENHGFYLQTADRVEKLIKTVNCPNYGLTLDMGNFLCLNQDPVDAVKRMAKYAIMAHVKDFHVRPKKTIPPSGWFATPTPIALRGAIVGHGVIDVPAQLKLLKKARYNWYLSLEFEGMEDPPKAIKLGLEYLKKEMTALGVLDS